MAEFILEVVREEVPDFYKRRIACQLFSTDLKWIGCTNTFATVESVGFAAGHSLEVTRASTRPPSNFAENPVD